MTKAFSDGHIQSQDEKDRDAATVMAIVAQMPAYSEAERTLAHDALVPFTPDDARASRIEREDEEALWAARLAAGPDVAADDSDATGHEEPRHRCDSCGQRYVEMVEHSKHGRPCCPHCGFTGVPVED